jgi:hypothetical protein
MYGHILHSKFHVPRHNIVTARLILHNVNRMTKYGWFLSLAKDQYRLLSTILSTATMVTLTAKAVTSVRSSSWKVPGILPSFKLEFSEWTLVTTPPPPHVKFEENPSSGSPVVPCWQTDKMKLTVVFRNSANAPRKPLFCVNIPIHPSKVCAKMLRLFRLWSRLGCRAVLSVHYHYYVLQVIC